MRNWISSGVNQYVWYIILSGFCMINSDICLSSVTPKNFIEDFLSISLLFSFIFGGIFIGWCRAAGGMGVGGLWAVSKVKRVPCLPRFNLLEGFSDTLLVVSILDIVYDCHLWQLLQF